MKGVIKTGVAIRKDTLIKLESYMKSMGITNRSKIIDEALELFLAERRVLLESGVVGGAILIYFDHDAEEELTHIQHDFLDIVISNTHAHIDEENCIEAILVKGDVKKIKKLISAIENLKGIKAVRFGFFSIK